MGSTPFSSVLSCCPIETNFATNNFIVFERRTSRSAATKSGWRFEAADSCQGSIELGRHLRVPRSEQLQLCVQGRPSFGSRQQELPSFRADRRARQLPLLEPQGAHQASRLTPEGDAQDRDSHAIGEYVAMKPGRDTGA